MRFILICLFMLSSAFAQEIYNVKEKSIDGKEFLMSSLKGKVVLIVNIASQCGYTPQLAKLESLHKKYQAKGLVVLGVPTNDFMSQTPEDDKGMLEFCKKNYDVTFPLLTKATIKGDKGRELYKILTKKTPTDSKGEVGWNFEKFLISKKGEIITRFGSSFDPLDEKLVKQIEAQL